MLKIFYYPVQPFLSHPLRAYLLAALFAILLATSLARSRRFNPRAHLVPLFAVLSWVLFGLNEELARANAWDIRVDVLISWPLVLVISIGAAWTWLRTSLSRNPSPTR